MSATPLAPAARLRLSVLALASLLMPLVTAAQRPMHTESGELIGTFANGVRVFLGVPYAASPVGPLRWKAPQPVRASATPLAADRIGASCMQKLSRSHLPWTEEFMVQNETSEDCLTLNIWVPAKPAATKLPVLVYIHGGAFVEGSGSVVSYDGTALARRGLIVVDINYRLGIFGYFANSELAAEAGSAGNYGLLDAIAALGWVKHNIGAIGGDPARVAVAGQSAGAQSVLDLMASPLAKGLFSRAIVNSGPQFGPTAVLPAKTEALKAGDTWSAAHGGTLSTLRAIPAAQLLELSDVPPQARRPIVDGMVLPEQPREELDKPVGSDVPVIAGWNADEGSSSPTYGTISAANFRADAAKKYGAAAERFLTLYPAATDTEASRSQIAAARDRNFAVAALWAQTRGSHRSSPVYLYYFSRVPPWKAHPEFAAHHTAEVPYFFATLDKVRRDYTAADTVVSDAASGAWVHFAETGVPGPGWKPAATASGPFFELGDSRGERSMLDEAHAAFWRDVLSGSR